MPFQQTLYAVYGNRRSYYGNAAYGSAPRYLQVYGAWPEDKPPQPEMLVEDWQESLVVSKPQALYEAEIASRIAIIKDLKAKIEIEDQLTQKNILREQMRIERMAKERAFKLKAMVDEEESLFIILN